MGSTGPSFTSGQIGNGADGGSSQDARPDPQLPLFYRSISAVDAIRHGGKSLRRSIGFGFARHAHAVVLNGNEFELASRHYPIVFTSQPQIVPLALLGLKPGQNLFLRPDGEWRPSTYVPAYVRRYPFILHTSADNQQFTLCADESSGAFEDGAERPLFIEGKPSEALRSAFNFCAAFHNDFNATREFGDQLVERGLLVPNQAEVTLASGEKLAVSGFEVIDRGRFSGLPDSAFLEWRRKGWIGWVYAHFLSQGNWPALVDMAAGTTTA
jgi:hypothetical protein